MDIYYSTLTSIFINFSILFTLSILYTFIINNVSKSEFIKSITIGFIFGILAVIGLISPFGNSSHCIFNGYTVILATAGIIGGILSSIAAFIVVTVYISLIFASNVATEIAIIVIACILGGTYGFFRWKWSRKLDNNLNIYFNALLLQVVTVILIYIFPTDPFNKNFVKIYAIILIGIYPIVQFSLVKICDSIKKFELKQKELEIANLRLIEAGRLAHLGNWEFDIKKNIFVLDNEILKIFDVIKSNMSLTFDNFLDIIHPDDRKKVKEIFHSSIRRKKEFFITHKIIAQNKGDTKYIESRGKIICNKNGAPIKAFGTILDVSERYIFQNKIQKTLFQTFQAVSKALEIKDAYTKNHQSNVANLSARLAIKLKWSEDKLMGLYFAALVHDIGKIGLPMALLNKSGPLTKADFEEIKKHCLYGYKIFNELDYPWPIKDIIFQHHEKCDGSGYPSGLKGNEITGEAKIITICNLFEAIINERPYRKALGLEYAIRELKTGMGTLYDSKYTELLLEIIESKEFDFQHVPEEIENIFSKFY